MSDAPKEPSADEVFRDAGNRELAAADAALTEAEEQLGPRQPWVTEDADDAARREIVERLRRIVDIVKSTEEPQP